MKKLTLFLIALCAISCVRPVHQFQIGFSQCMDDAWRQTMNEEMRREMLIHPEFNFSTRTAYGSNELQCAQIDSFIAEKVNLLIVSPNEADAIQPAVSRAFRAGIPVIVADRRVQGNEYTAFIGGDNHRIGQLMGEWLCQLATPTKNNIHQPMHVLEVYGLPGSTPARLRHEGLLDVLDSDSAQLGRREIVLASVGGEWMKEDAYLAVKRYLSIHKNIEAIVAQNDLMAIGAAEAVRDSEGYGAGSVSIMGVDGIMLGLQAIVDHTIDCSATYSSRGDLVIKTAAQILEHQPFVRDTVLETTIIDETAAHALLIQYRDYAHNIETMQTMQIRSDALWEQVRRQGNLILWGVVVMFLIFAFMLIYNIVMHRRLNKKIKNEVVPQMEEVIEALKLNSRDAAFSEQLRELVDEHLQDENLSVEFLGQQMGLSRTQIFRRVKAVSGKGPLEYIRERRLIKADELLHTTDMTVQQVANTFCFSTPGYFTKCYKQHFGHLPSAR